MLRGIDNKQWSVEKYLLTLPVLDIVIDQVLVDIALIPLKPCELFKFIFNVETWFM
jgi:hypothetical protein